MSEIINAEDCRRDDLNKMAVEAGLTDADKYTNKPAVAWPHVLPRSRWGRRPAEPLAYTRVRPEVVVELVVDPAVDGPRWRTPPPSSAYAPTSDPPTSNRST